MNIAFSTLFIFIIAIPGFLFRRIYYSGPFRKDYFKTTIQDTVFSSLIISCIMHLLCIEISLWIQPALFPLDYKAFYGFFSGNRDDINYTIKVLFLEKFHIVSYFVFGLFLSFALGHFVRTFIRFFKWDRKFTLFRFKNEWHYFFTGEILDFPYMEGSSDSIDCCRLDIVSDVGGTLILFSGIYTEATFTSEGGVDRIFLIGTKRCLIEDDKTPNIANPYILEGDIFCIPYSTIANLNATYLQINISPELQRTIDNETTADQPEAN